MRRDLFEGIEKFAVNYFLFENFKSKIATETRSAAESTSRKMPPIVGVKVNAEVMTCDLSCSGKVKRTTATASKNAAMPPRNASRMIFPILHFSRFCEAG